MKYFLGSYNFFQYVFFMILYMTWVKLAKLTLLTTRVVLTTSSNNIFDSRDNVTFSSLLSIFILFAVFKCRGGGGKERDRESLKIWQLTALWGQRANISAIIGLWKELSKRKVFKKQLIIRIKRLRQFCGIKKKPEKNPCCTDNAWTSADIKIYMSAADHALYVQHAFFFQIINFTGKRQT